MSNNVEKIYNSTKWLAWLVLALIACSISAACFIALILSRSSV